MRVKASLRDIQKEMDENLTIDILFLEANIQAEYREILKQ